MEIISLATSVPQAVLALYTMNNVQVVSLALAAVVTAILIAKRRSRRKKA